MKELKGIIAPIPTPFNDNEELALDELGRNLERWSQTKLSGFVLLGSTGEFVYLTTDEKKAVFQKAREVVPSDRIMLAGTGSESTRETIALTRWAGELGVDFAMVVTPAYYKKAMKPEILRAHYIEVAEKSPIPIVLYNVPIFTMLNMDAELAMELASHPNIIGIKDSSGNFLQLQEMCRLAPEGFSVLTGSASLLLASLTVGAAGGILAAANVAFDLCVDLKEAFEKGDLARARQLQNRLVPINKAVTVDYGIGGQKALLDRMGFYGGPPRSPLRRPSADIVEELVRVHTEACTEEVSHK
jgi:4-hydroxy-2-oxoglutarate aldolase